MGPCLALEGGGIRSMSMFTALTAGLMREASGPGEAEPTLKGTGLYARFTGLSSTSGGTWFAASLAYSECFLRLVEDIAARPGEAETLYGENWTNRYPQIGSVGGTWTNFVLNVLETTAGIDASYTLGQQAVMDWARGKTWLVCHTLAAAGSTDIDAVHIYEHDEPRTSITCKLEGSSGFFIPATYSIVLGSGSDRAPLPYVAETAVPPAARWSYTGMPAGESWWSLCRPSSYRAKSASVGAFDNLREGAGSLPVVSCAAASSAAAGAAIVSAESTAALDARGSVAAAAVWQGRGAGRDTFSEAEAMVRGLTSPASVTQAAVDELARVGVCAAIDGAYTDNTGVAHAVAAGSTEVVAFLNGCGSEEVALTSLVALFTGPYTIDGVAQKPSASPFFQEAATDKLAECLRFDHLEVAAAAARPRLLRSISFGTLTATTAASASKLYGIAAGTSVSLRVVAVAAVDAEVGDNARNFDKVVQDIVDTIASSSGLVRERLLPWFLAA